eukprot:5672709-Amphidinium_carterae.1
MAGEHGEHQEQAIRHSAWQLKPFAPTKPTILVAVLFPTILSIVASQDLHSEICRGHLLGLLRVSFGCGVLSTTLRRTVL